MAIFFSGRELAEIAVDIERNGAAFYDTLARTTRNDRVRAAYDYLAGEERKHIRLFQSILDSLGEGIHGETYSGEHALYIRSLADSRVFTDAEVAMEVAERAQSDAEALHLALGFEKDSLLLYWEMRELVREVDRGVVDRLMEEERSHIRQLTELKAQIEERVSGEK
ncbi:MAG: ferritin family protein [Dehalococcoidia bacterium]